MGVDAKNRMIRKLVRGHMADNRPLTQVDRIILAFGGVPALKEALLTVGKRISKVSIYRWNHPKSRGGAGGVIPSYIMGDVLAAARHIGIMLSSDFLDPRPTMGESVADILDEAKRAGEDPQ